MKKRIAVIDLGTNTFHILVKDLFEDKSSEIVYRFKKFVKLAEKGIETIHPAPYQRGLDTLKEYRAKMNELKVDEIYAIGTAALRTASNGAAFVEDVKREAGIEIQLISGSDEAELITRGVRDSIPFTDEIYLIMDIGGGSVEFIFANDSEIFWLKSFPIGAAVLKNRFHKNEPITFAEIDTLKDFLKETLQEVFEQAEKLKPTRLVGASGTFDTLVDLYFAPLGRKRGAESTYHPISNCLFFDLMESMLIKNLEQRKSMPGMSKQRSDMIVVACVLVDIVISEMKLDVIVQTDYAMKEGIFWSRLMGLEV